MNSGWKRLFAVVVYATLALAATPLWLRHYDALAIIPKPVFAALFALLGGSTQEDVADAEAATVFLTIVVLTAPVFLLFWWLSHRRR